MIVERQQLVLPFQLERPLVGLDVETHAFVGPEEARIVDIGIVRIAPDGVVSKVKGQLINPTIPITTEATTKHGITNEMVAAAPTFRQLAVALFHLLVDVDFAGFNHKAFDLPVLRAEFARCNIGFSWRTSSLLDGYHLWRLLQPRTLTDAVKTFLDREPTEAHRALGDTIDAVEVVLAMASRLQKTPAELHAACFPEAANAIDSEGKFVWGPNDIPTFNFGKYRGKPLHVADIGFWRWMLNADFAPDTKAIVRGILNGTYPSKT